MIIFRQVMGLYHVALLNCQGMTREATPSNFERFYDKYQESIVNLV